jgi:hypothetical protein
MIFGVLTVLTYVYILFSTLDYLNRQQYKNGNLAAIYKEKDQVSLSGIHKFEYLCQQQLLEDNELNWSKFISVIKTKLDDIRSRGYVVYNIVLYYINEQNKTEWLSLPSNLVKEVGIEGALKLMEERKDTLYIGSEEVEEIISRSTLSYYKFDIIVEKIRGSGGRHKYTSFYKVKNVGKHGECLISCIRYYSNGKKYLPRTARKKANLNITEFGLQDIPILEKIYNTQVAIYVDRKDISYIIEDNKIKVLKNEPILLYGSKTCLNKILYHENHFSIITNEHDIVDVIKLHLQEKEDDESRFENINPNKRKKYYYFFDFETVFDSLTGNMIPYAWTIMKFDKKGKLLDDKTCFGKPSHEIGELFIRYLDEQPYGGKKYLIGYNNSRFDNYLLMRYGYKVKNVFFAGNSILGMNVHDMETFDLCRMLSTSLKKAAESFKCKYNKKELDHNNVQRLYMQNKFYKISEREVRKYVANDVQVLAELFFKASNSFYEITGLNIEEYPTIAALSYNKFKQNCKGNLELPILDYETDQFVRKSIIGGRSQVFNRRIEEIEKILCLDIVSLYPYIMMNRKFPVGKPVKTNEYIQDKIGVYNVTIHKQPQCKIIPYRNNDNSLDWNYDKEFDTVVTSVDIECILKNNGKITVHDGITWNEYSENIFEYLKPIKDEKLRQDFLKKHKEPSYNPAMRECLKLILNSLSGKFLQRIFKKTRCLIHNKKDLQNFSKRTSNQTFYMSEVGHIIGEGEKIKSKVTMPSIYGVLIYSYSRQYMYEELIKRVDSKYITDTDSLIYTQKEHKLLCAQNKIEVEIGEEFGMAKEELMDEIKIEEGEEGPFGNFVDKKCYSIYKYNKDRKRIPIKMRFKGIKPSDKVIQEPSCIKNKTLSQLSYMYESIKETLSINCYENLINGKDIHFLCSRIGKSTRSLQLTQNFILKTINSSGNIIETILD